MKAALFKGNFGAVTGRLSNPNEIKWEDNGHIKTFHLIGNVIDTEYNDVLILGEKKDEDTLYVNQMESLLLNEILYFKGEGASVISIPKNFITSIEVKYTDTKVPYHVLKIAESKNTYITFTVFGVFEENTNSSCLVFVMGAPLEEKEEKFGAGYAVKTITYKIGSGYQLLS